MYWSFGIFELIYICEIFGLLGMWVLFVWECEYLSSTYERVVVINIDNDELWLLLLVTMLNMVAFM